MKHIGDGTYYYYQCKKCGLVIKYDLGGVSEEVSLAEALQDIKDFETKRQVNWEKREKQRITNLKYGDKT